MENLQGFCRFQDGFMTVFQSKTLTSNCGNYTISFDGEIYNHEELMRSLKYNFKFKSDAEIALAAYIQFGNECANHFNGVFSFVISDSNRKKLFFCRDRLGVKPLFYGINHNALYFGSRPKNIFANDGLKPQLNKESLSELFGLFPSRTEGFGLFENLSEVKYGSFGIFSVDGYFEKKYWELKCVEHDLSYEETLQKVKSLTQDAVKLQMNKSADKGSLLSGGLDSSIVTAIMAKEMDEPLKTYSFDYEENELYFQSNSFQVDMDKLWVGKMVDYLKTDHSYLECGIDTLVDYLYKAVDAKDMPGMADIDSSLIYFCGEVAKTSNSTLTGECSDEIFGGYPWFHTKDKIDSFPWIRNTDFRKLLLSKDLLNKIDIDLHIKNRYEYTISQVPTLETDSQSKVRERELSYINHKWFMTNLLDRMDAMGRYNGLTGRVPFADHRLIEFLWNVPWEFKCNGTPKSLLREAFKGDLPDEILFRKKSPFPKTYHPRYEKMLSEKLKLVMDNKNSPIAPLLNKEKVFEFLATPSDYGKPWYGQLMAGPQLMAFYLQINYWLDKYKIEIQI